MRYTNGSLTSSREINSKQSNSFTVRKRQGTTLFTILIAIVLLSLAAVPLLTSLIDQTKATKMSKMRIFANQLACNMIERYRTEKFSQVAAILNTLEAGETTVLEDELLNPPNADVRYLNLMRQYKRMLILSPINRRMGVLDVYVNWTEDGHLREVRMSTILVDTEFYAGRPGTL